MLAWNELDTLDSNNDPILNNDEQLQIDNLALLVIKYYFFDGYSHTSMHGNISLFPCSSVVLWNSQEENT